MPSIISGDANVSATEFGYLDGVTSAIQTQLAARPTGTTGAWTAYTPALTNITLGSGGTVTGRYLQLGKFVAFGGKITLGTSFSMGDAKIALPVAAADTTTICAVLSAEDVGSNVYPLYVDMGLSTTTTAIRIGCMNASTTYASFGPLSSTIPFTWVAGDIIYFSGHYEAA